MIPPDNHGGFLNGNDLGRLCARGYLLLNAIAPGGARGSSDFAAVRVGRACACLARPLRASPHAKYQKFPSFNSLDKNPRLLPDQDMHLCPLPAPTAWSFCATSLHAQQASTSRVSARRYIRCRVRNAGSECAGRRISAWSKGALCAITIRAPRLSWLEHPMPSLSSNEAVLD